MAKPVRYTSKSSSFRHAPSPSALSAKRDDSVAPEKKEYVKNLRAQAKALLDGLKDDYFYAPRPVWEKDMRDARPSMVVLAKLVKKFADALGEKKRARNLIDFSDMEQFALAILTEEKDGRHGTAVQ